MAETDHELIGVLRPLSEIDGVLSAPSILIGTLNSNSQLFGTFSAIDSLLTGSLSPQGSLTGRLSEEGGLAGTLSEPSDFGHYKGNYIIAPDFEGQTLNTNNKIMDADVEVKAIQVSITSNIQGGNTVYIGGEINYG